MSLSLFSPSLYIFFLLRPANASLSNRQRLIDYVHYSDYCIIQTPIQRYQISLFFVVVVV